MDTQITQKISPCPVQSVLSSGVQAHDVPGEERMSTHGSGVLQTHPEVQLFAPYYRLSVNM